MAKRVFSRPSEAGEQAAVAQRARYGGESDTDPRLVEYIEALKAYDIDHLIELRLVHREEEGLMRRFRTVERSFAGLLALYEREIQILRVEVDAWKSIDEGRDRLEAEGLDRKQKAAARQCIYRGVAKLEKMAVARKTQSEIELPNTFV